MLKPKNSWIPLWTVAAIAVISSGLPAGAQQSIWNATNGLSVNTNWSTAANWSPNGVPGAATNVLFNDGGATTAPGLIDNVVDVNTTIQQLVFRQTNGVHNMVIKPGVTLNISNSVATTNLQAGTENLLTSFSTLMVTNTISGAGGTLAMTSTNVASVLVVRQINTTAGSHLSTLDLSGLDTFNASIGNVWVGVYPGTTTTRPQGVLYLAKTNVIVALAVGTKSAPSIDIGDTGSSPESGNTLALGITNNIAADTIVVGNQRSGGILKFNPAFTNITTPALYLRGHSNTRVNTFNISDQSSATANIGSVSSGNVDFSGGSIDALVNGMALAWGQPISGSGAGTATATLTMTAGTLNVNTMDIAVQTNTAVTGSPVTGTVNVNGGTLTVNSSLRIAYYGGAGAASTGRLNITNGTVLATNIVAGGGSSTINMNGGRLVVTNTVGTLTAPLTALNLSGGATLQFTAANGVIPAQVASLTSDNTGIINVGSVPAIASYPAQFPLIAYQGGSGSGLTFAVGTLPGTFTGYISNDNTSTIYVVITNGPSLSSVTWAGGANNFWDTTSLNWTNKVGATVRYANLSIVTFDDTAKTNNVNVTGTFTNSAWVQNNSALNYTFSGIGGITGSGGLTLNGNGSVTLAQTGGDNFSGGIAANAGTLNLDDANCAIAGGLTIASGATVRIGNNDVNGALPVGAVDNEGTLIFSHNNDVVVSTLMSGAGALTQNGNGTLFLTVSNSYTGNTTVTAGTLALTNSGSITGSAQVTVTGAKLDVSGVPGATTLSTLNLNNANVTMAVGYLQTNFNVSALNMGGTTNTLSITALPPIASYPLTLTVIQCAGAIGGFNMGLGTLPAGYTGSVSQSGDTTAVLLTLNSGPVGVRPGVIWSGGDAGVTTNWSDRLNWQQPGVPTTVDNVVFNNTDAGSTDMSSPGGGAAALNPGGINNFVDANFTISTLTYTNNGGSFHDTAIANGVTLTVTNTFTVGAMDSASVLQQIYVNIAGGGATFNVNNTNSNLQVWEGDSGTAASLAGLDLSALDNFTANVSRLAVGACAINNAVNRPGGIVYLAKTNVITTTFQAASVESGSTTGNSGIVLGDCNQNAGPASYIYLGQANTISADTIGIARQKSTASMLFNPIYANVAPYPSVTFKGFSSNLVSILDVGDGLGNSGTTAGTGDLNLAGGVVTATVDTLNVGRASNASSGTGNTTGTLEFDAGTITANTVNVGLQPVTGSKTGTGTISVGTNTTIGMAATLVVNGSLTLAGNVNNAATMGTLDINGGTVQANTIVAGPNGSTSTINLNAGTLSVGTAGTTAAPLTTLSLADATTLQLAVSGAAHATNIVAAAITTGGTTALKIGALTGVATNVIYPLINYTGTDPYPNLSFAPLPAGYAGTFADNSGSNVVVLVLTAVPPPPQPAHITGISVSGTTLNISATNGVHGGSYVLLGTTNLTKSLAQWTPLLTNNFDGGGNLNLSTNIINPSLPQQFLLIAQ
jgi:autotransporter-associated beta strand protein